MKADIVMRQSIHEKRGTESWVISEKEIETDVADTLIGAHINVHDYYALRPYFVIPIFSKMKVGKIFDNVYLISPWDIPETFTCFLLNGMFLRTALVKEIEDEQSGETHHIHDLEAIQHLLNSEDFIKKFTELQRKTGCMLIGVYQTDPIHLNRGIGL